MATFNKQRGAKLCLSKELRDLHSFLGHVRYYSCAESFLVDQNQGIMPGHKGSYSSQKPSLRDPAWLRGGCTPRGGS